MVSARRNSLVGRDDVVAVADAVLDRAAGGEACSLVVRGESGMGKSTIIEHVVRRARAEGFTVLATRGRTADAEIGFASLLTMLRSVESEMSALAGDLEPAVRAALTLGAEQDLDGIAVRLGVYRIITGLAERTPVLLAVDDAQLLDAATADVMAFVLGRLAADPVASVLTTDGPVPALLGAMPGRSVVLAPLALDHVHTIVRADGPIVDEALDRCCALAGGNPLVALELARSLHPEERDGRRPVPPVPRPPSALVHGMVAQMAELPPSTQRALVVVAADDTGELKVVRGALADLGEPADALDTAEAAGLVHIDGASIRLAHPLWRAVAYHQVAPPSRRAAHRALARNLDLPHDAAARAWQLAAAAEGTDESAASALELVADDLARRGGAASAARVLERSALLTPDIERRTRRLISAARAWLGAHRPIEAGRVIEPARMTPLAGPTEGLSAVVCWLDGPAAARSLGFSPEGDRSSDCLPTIDPLPEMVGAESLIAARAARDRGEVVVAYDLVSVVVDALPGEGGLVSVPVLLTAADLELMLGRRDDAMLRLAQLVELLRGRGWTAAEAAVARLRGRAALDRGDFGVACHELESAFETWPWSVLPDLAAALCAQGRQVEVAALPARLTGCAADDPVGELQMTIARALLDGNRPAFDAAVTVASQRRFLVPTIEAELTFQEIAPRAASDMSGEDAVGNIAKRLHALGVHGWDQRLARSGQSGAAVSTSGVATELTAAEYRVALAVATGATNREVATTLFLSVKTVDFHLQNIYRKLGLRSRTELAVRMSHDTDPRAAREASS